MYIQKTIQEMIQKAVEARSPGKVLKKDGRSSYFFYINNTVPNPEQTLQEIYEKYKGADGFLYITYG